MVLHSIHYSAMERVIDDRRFVALRGLDEDILSLDKLEKSMPPNLKRQCCFCFENNIDMEVCATMVLAQVLLAQDVAKQLC